MVIQVESLFLAIAAKRLDVLPSHPCPEEMSTKPMPATARAEMVLKPLGHGIMRAGAPGIFDHDTKDSCETSSQTNIIAAMYFCPGAELLIFNLIT